MRSSLGHCAALFLYAALSFTGQAQAQITKLNVGYVGVTSDNAAAFVARDTGRMNGSSKLCLRGEIHEANPKAG